jgi:hypothetical protein
VLFSPFLEPVTPGQEHVVVEELRAGKHAMTKLDFLRIESAKVAWRLSVCDSLGQILAT